MAIYAVFFCSFPFDLLLTFPLQRRYLLNRTPSIRPHPQERHRRHLPRRYSWHLVAGGNQSWHSLWLSDETEEVDRGISSHVGLGYVSGEAQRIWHQAVWLVRFYRHDGWTPQTA